MEVDMPAAAAEGKVVCPGDRIMTLPPSGLVRIGAGVQQAGQDLVALKAGVLRLDPKAGRVWVQGRQRRYIPSPGDPVVGVILARRGDNYDVDVGGPAPASLPTLAFENATRRNRPNLRDGDLVYCRVTAADRDMPAELSCVDAAGDSAGFGPLKEGTLVRCSTALARSLLAQPPPPALALLGSTLQFELAVGCNGRVWVHAGGGAEAAIAVCRGLELCEGRGAAQAEAAVAALLRGPRRQRQGGSGAGG